MNERGIGKKKNGRAGRVWVGRREKKKKKENDGKNVRGACPHDVGGMRGR